MRGAREDRLGLADARWDDDEGLVGWGKKFGPNPTDCGKGGVKRILLTDGHGLPLALVIAGAHRHDSMLLEQTLASVVIDRLTNSSRSWLCVDLGYVGRRLYEHALWIGMVPWIRGRRDESKAKRESARGRRCVVERSHSWRNRYRHLLILWEKRADTYLAMLHFACGLIVWHYALSG